MPKVNSKPAATQLTNQYEEMDDRTLPSSEGAEEEETHENESRPGPMFLSGCYNNNYDNMIILVV